MHCCLWSNPRDQLSDTEPEWWQSISGKVEGTCLSPVWTWACNWSTVTRSDCQEKPFNAKTQAVRHLQTCNKRTTHLQLALTDLLTKAKRNLCTKVHLYCSAAGDQGPSKRGSIHTQCKLSGKILTFWLCKETNLPWIGSEAELEISKLSWETFQNISEKAWQRGHTTPLCGWKTDEEVLISFPKIQRNEHQNHWKKSTNLYHTLLCSTIQFYND